MGVASKAGALSLERHDVLLPKEFIKTGAGMESASVALEGVRIPLRRAPRVLLVSAFMDLGNPQSKRMVRFGGEQ